ncbi:MAG: hypothetical protein GY863_06820 [bacterium]|nr:hypothetical protein [bacterium]
MKRLVLISAILVLYLSGRSYSQQNTPDMEKYFVLLKKALSLDENQFDIIWQGYDLNNYPVGLFDNDRAYLINHPKPGDQFSETERTVNGHKIYNSDSRIPQFYANTAVKYNDAVTSIFMVDEKMTDEEFSNLLFHEGFHSFADTLSALRGRYGDAFLVPFFPSDNPPYYAYAYIEQQLLREAFNSQDASSAFRKIQEYYYIFFRRINMVGEVYSDFEYNEQIYEGLAAYAGLKGLELMGYGELAKEKLTGLLNNRIEKPEDFKKRSNGTGAVLAYLLDRFYPGWKNDLESNINLTDLLRLKIPPTDNIDEDELLMNYNFEALKAQFHRSLYKRKAELRALRKSIMNFDRIEVVFPADIRMTLNFDPMNLTALNDTLLYHGRSLKLILKDNFIIEMNGTPSITEISPGNMFLVNRLMVGKPAEFEIILDGRKVERINGETVFRDLVFESGNLKMQLTNGILKPDFSNIIIELKK